MIRPLNGCMCQDGSCESCNRVVEAFEAMREALRAATTERPKTDLPTALAVVDQCRAALALADEVKS